MTELTQTEIQAVLQEGEYAVLGISDGNEPYVLTLHYGLDDPGETLYFLTGKGGVKLDFFKSNPYVCGTVVLPREERWESVLFRGVVEVLHGEEACREACARVLSQGGTLPPEAAGPRMVLKLEIDEISGRTRPRAGAN